jgi:2-iminobutanoate/2-iminopropanoate deaminase
MKFSVALLLLLLHLSCFHVFSIRILSLLHYSTPSLSFQKHRITENVAISSLSERLFLPSCNDDLSQSVSDETSVPEFKTVAAAMNRLLAIRGGGGCSGCPGSSKKREIVLTTDAPKPIGPYSQAVKNKGNLYISGCIGTDPVSGKLASGDIKEQALRALKNMDSILKAGDSCWTSIHKVTIFVTDLKQFSVINNVYSEFLKSNNVTDFPARTTIEVSALPLDAKFEIDAVASYCPRQ